MPRKSRSRKSRSRKPRSHKPRSRKPHSRARYRAGHSVLYDVFVILPYENQTLNIEVNRDGTVSEDHVKDGNKILLEGDLITSIRKFTEDGTLQTNAITLLASRLKGNEDAVQQWNDYLDTKGTLQLGIKSKVTAEDNEIVKEIKQKRKWIKELKEDIVEAKKERNFSEAQGLKDTIGEHTTDLKALMKQLRAKPLRYSGW